MVFCLEMWEHLYTWAVPTLLPHMLSHNLLFGVTRKIAIFFKNFLTTSPTEVLYYFKSFKKWPSKRSECTFRSLARMMYRVLIKHCGFFDDFEWNILDSWLPPFSLGVSVCIQTRQVEHQRCRRTGRVQKNHKILRKNTIITEHPVLSSIKGMGCSELG